MRMTKKNKTSTARETVYDRCAYVGCYNGKFINGHKLFHFPAETDRRLEMWIERSGNFRLRTWAATSLRKAGLCGDHFDERSFTNGTRKALRRNVVPRHYTEDLKYRQANRGNRETLCNNSLLTARVEEMGETINFEETSSLSGDFEGLEEVAYSKDAYKKASKESGKDNGTLEAIKTTEKSGTSSPLVEFIVEELDETLISQKSALTVNSSGEEDEEKEDEDPDDDDEEEEEEKENGAAEAETDSVMGFGTSSDEENSGLAVTSSDVTRSSEISRTESPAQEAPHSEDLVNEKDVTLPRKRTCCPYNDLCSNPAHEKTLQCLRNENERLRRKNRRLKEILGGSRAREASYTKIRNTLNSIDEFLDVQECTNPATRAMVKLSLHKSNTPYTKEEKEFAIQLYRNSVRTFVNLRRSGCNFPGKSTMKQWITEDNGGKIVDDLVRVNEVEGVEAYDAVEEDEGLEAAYIDNNDVNDASHPNGTFDDPLTLVHMETEIHYMPEAIDGVEQVLESSEIQQIHHLVHHFEACTDGDRVDKEFTESTNAQQETFS